MPLWRLAAYLCFLPLSSTDLVQYKSSFQLVSIECNGLLQHDLALRSSLMSFGEIEYRSSLESDTVYNKLPRCLLSLGYNNFALQGIGEISKETLQNAVALLLSNFISVLDTFDSENGYLRVYGTLFQTHSYVKAVVNLCGALGTEPKFKCYFVDVIKNPSVLVANPRPIPWIEIKTHNMTSSVVMTDPHPNLWKFKQQAGIADETQPENDNTNLAQCFDNDCSVNLARDELLYNYDYWRKEILPHKPVKIAYLGDTGIAEAPTEVLQVLNGESNSLSASEIVSFKLYYFSDL